MKLFKTFYWMGVLAGIGFIAGYGISELILMGLKRTGDLIMAKDSLQLKILPYTFAIIGAWIGYKINEDE